MNNTTACLFFILSITPKNFLYYSVNLISFSSRNQSFLKKYKNILQRRFLKSSLGPSQNPIDKQNKKENYKKKETNQAFCYSSIVSGPTIVKKKSQKKILTALNPRPWQTFVCTSAASSHFRKILVCCINQTFHRYCIRYGYIFINFPNFYFLN